MIYQVRSLSVYGGIQTWSFDSKQDALVKVRELKDFGDMFLVKLVEIPKLETV
tara:strand:+ start:491 stop:649 length:159 start_codon:yes stop_codon:yes gene_type:complete